MKNTQSIKDKLAGLATQSPEEQVKTIATITGLLDANEQEHAELEKKHTTLIVDYGKLATSKLSTESSEERHDEKPKAKTEDDIFNEIFNKKEK